MLWYWETAGLIIDSFTFQQVGEQPDLAIWDAAHSLISALPFVFEHLVTTTA
jgi:hypothetical protein